MPGIVERLEMFFARTAIPGVVGVYLFGSQNEGRVHRDSDIDVGVLVEHAALPTRGERFALRVRLAAELLSISEGALVDVVILNDVPPELARRVATSGRRVFNSSPEQNHAFVRDAQLMAADIAPFLRRTRRIKLEAMKS